MQTYRDKALVIVDKLIEVLDAVDPKIVQFWDDAHTNFIDVLMASEKPSRGLCTYSTICLSETSLFLDGKEFDVRTEFIGVCEDGGQKFANVIATLAFCVMNSKWLCAPGSIFPDVIRMHEASSTLSDIYFATPFLWGDRLFGSVINGKKTAWLMAVPISRAEAEFARLNGPLALENLLEERGVNIFDLNRISTVR